MVQETNGDPIKVGGKSGSRFFEQLSDAVQALRSMQSGTSSPVAAAMPGGALWLDTTSGDEIVKQRNPGDTKTMPLWRGGAWPVSLVPEPASVVRTAAFDLDEDDGGTAYMVDTSGGAIVATLDSAKVTDWQPYWVIIDVGGNTLTLTPKAGQTWANGTSAGVSFGSTAGTMALVVYGSGTWWNLIAGAAIPIYPRLTRVAKSSAFTLWAGDTAAVSEDYYACTGTFAATMPSAASVDAVAGRVVRVKNIGVGAITLTAAGSDTMEDGVSTTLVLSGTQAATLISDGVSNWEII